MRYLQLLLPTLIAVAMSYPQSKFYEIQQLDPKEDQLYYVLDQNEDGILDSRGLLHRDQNFDLEEDSQPSFYVAEVPEDVLYMTENPEGRSYNSDGDTEGIFYENEVGLFDKSMKPNQNISKVIEVLKKKLNETENNLEKLKVLPEVFKHIAFVMNNRLNRRYVPDVLKLGDYKGVASKLNHLSILERSFVQKNVKQFWNNRTRTFTSQYVIHALSSYENILHVLKLSRYLVFKADKCSQMATKQTPFKIKLLKSATLAQNAVTHFRKALKSAEDAYNDFVKASKMAGSKEVAKRLPELKRIVKSARHYSKLFNKHADDGLRQMALSETAWPGTTLIDDFKF